MRPHLVAILREGRSEQLGFNYQLLVFMKLLWISYNLKCKNEFVYTFA